MKIRGFATAVLILLTLAGGILPAHASDKPNLIFILTDDQRFDMMGNMNPALHTPNMDRLAGEGMRFGHAFVTTPICMASRASILSSSYERTHRYTGGAPTIQTPFMELSYPALLKRAGYRTGYVGKWHVKVEPGVTDMMFDSYVPLSRNPYFKKMPDGSLRHLTDITGDKAIEFLHTVTGDQPFCLSLNFNAPHAEDKDPRQYIYPEAMEPLYQGLDIPRPPLSDPAFFEALPSFLRYESMNRHRFYWRFDNEYKRQLLTKGYYRMISGVDAVIGRVMEEIEKLGLAENTVIMMMGDNGYFVGERGWAGKWKPHEVSIHVPLLVYDPKLPPSERGRKPEQFALNVDIAPTLLDYAGIATPESWQGRSLLPIIRGETPADWRKDFFHEMLSTNKTICHYEAVRSERYTYARYFGQDPAYEELYDLETDGDQADNLVGDPDYQALLDQLRRRCDKLRDQYGGIFLPWPRKELSRAGRRR